MTEESKEISERDTKGRFVKGQSGNPAGRPMGTKNHIVKLKQDLELAVRQNVKSQDVIDILQAMVVEAKLGNVSAAKLILDKTISNAKDAEDVESSQGGIRVIVENATFKVENESSATTPKPIEGESTRIEE